MTEQQTPTPVPTVPLPVPGVTRKVSFDYELGEAGWPAQRAGWEGFLVTSVRITFIEDPDTAEGFYDDKRAWGYRANSDGSRSKRSKLGEIYPGLDFLDQFVHDAKVRLPGGFGEKLRSTAD